jgi:adenylate cyclase
MFFLMQEAIEARRSHYMTRYGRAPEFKAGAHIGKVVATEVGEIKSEIVYHGDVLNTAARIQGLCNQEGHSLLISADLADRLPLSDQFSLMSLGPRSLKGKAVETELFGVTKA